jgi:hypothetical protein
VLDFAISLVMKVIGDVILSPVLWAGRRVERWILGGALERAGRRAGRTWGQLRRSLTRLSS